MLRTLCKSKIISAHVTDVKVDYDGSLGISSEIMAKAGIVPFEKILAINVSNGNRFETYAITVKEPGRIALYGGTARLGMVGDDFIIISWSLLNEDEAKSYKGPVVVKLGNSNQV